jgi:hypothetical protein
MGNFSLGLIYLLNHLLRAFHSKLTSFVRILSRGMHRSGLRSFPDLPLTASTKTPHFGHRLISIISAVAGIVVTLTMSSRQVEQDLPES